jgi:hypothetical protein
VKTVLKIGLGIAIVVTLVVGGLGMGWLLWGRRLWAPAAFGGPGMTWRADNCGAWSSTMGRGQTGWGRGPGMMWGRSRYGQTPGSCGGALLEDCSVAGGYLSPTAANKITIEQAQQAVEAYVEDLDHSELEIDALMEFEYNFYAIVQEHDTDIGAMELLVNKSTGAVSPEMGPNMMWNARYGMHGRGGMMGTLSDRNTVSEGEALEFAQRWLDANRPGVTPEDHVDPFYGYYTIHTMRDGEIEGMLSVHGQTGQIWYHSWHGAFIQMIEGAEEHE